MKHLRFTLVALLIHTMCYSVVLSHAHAKDVTALFSVPGSSVKPLSGSDITSKALGDLHHHIDKAGVKNIHVDKNVTAARTRQLNPLDVDVSPETLGEKLHDFLLRLRVVTSLCFNYA